VRSAAVFAIWIHGDEVVTAKLAALLREDPDVDVRRQAAHGLGVATRSLAQAHDALLAAAEDRDQQVREKAHASLRRVRVAR
jgi:hypothetical protein